MDKIKLLKFPYPFQAALAICSDIDGTSWENFIAIHQFLNSNQNTLLGQGLSLPVGESFWMYDQQNIANAAFSYFSDYQGNVSEHAPIILDLIRAGIIDVMHGYGNFANADDFSRKLAVRAIEELDKYNLKLQVWTNHGGAESTQNVGELATGKGDIVPPQIDINNFNKPCYYHADLLKNYGIRFFWDREASLTSVVGQNNNFHFAEAFWRSPLYQGVKFKSKSIAKGMISIGNNVYHKITNKHFIPWQPLDPTNDLIQKVNLRDNTSIFRFKRFGNGRFDWQDDLSYLLNDRVLERLLTKQGYLILYIHLGDRKDRTDNKPMTKNAITKFQQLAELFHSGKLWIGTTSRLLTYNFVSQFLDWDYLETEAAFHIKINGIREHKNLFHLSLDDLRGITFMASTKKNIKIFFKDREIDIKITNERNHQIVMIPITPIEWPL